MFSRIAPRHTGHDQSWYEHEGHMSTTQLPQLSTSVPVQIPVGGATLRGRLTLGNAARGLVIIGNGDGDHVYDATNAYVARRLCECGFAALVVDLLTPHEAVEDAETSGLRFHQGLL